MTLFEQVWKFLVVGGSGLIVDFFITYVLKEKLKVHRYIANACGFIVATSTNFFLNKYWTFENYNEAISKQYVAFFLVSVGGLAINTLFLIFFEKKLKQSFYLSKILAMVMASFWNFTVNYLVTFA